MTLTPIEILWAILIIIIARLLTMAQANKTGGEQPVGGFMAELAKKFSARETFFAREDKNLLPFVDKQGLKRPGDFMFTPEGLISISPPSRARELVSAIKRHYRGDITRATITDATACNGGDTICFAKNFARVNSVEINPANYTALAHNVGLYHFRNVTTYNNDYLELLPVLKQDIVHIDAPWTGVDYKQHDALRLKLGDVYLEDVCARLIALPAPPHISLKVPKNFDREALRKTLPQDWTMIVEDVRKFDLLQIYRA